MSRPNILFITSDQQHWRTLGQLNPELQTPHLDRLAAEGTTFTRAYCPNPTCTPTRASLITGLYPSQHGAYSLGTKLSEKVPTIGTALGRAGYRTGLVGKAHFQPLTGSREYPSLESYPTLQDLAFWRDFHGPFYGFDHVELARNHTDEAHVGQHYALWLEEKGCTNWRDYFRSPTGHNDNQRRTWEIPEEFHYNTWITERTNAFMEQAADNGEPFFAWASYFDPHPDYLVPRPWDTMYDPADVTVPGLTPGEHDRNPPHFQKTQQESPDFSDWKEEGGHAMHGCSSHLHDRDELAKDIACYYGMVSCMDAHIGRLLAFLDQKGLADNTLVVFTSDHGHLFGQHGMIAKGPFHYEDLVKVPTLARWPGKIPAGRQCDALQTLVDMPVTFLEATGVAPEAPMAGVNQLPVWTGEAESARDHVLVENRHQPTTLQLHTFIDERYKLTTYRNHAFGELFDLQEDPDELHNRWDDPDFADLKTDLLRRLVEANMVKEPLFMPRIAGA